MAQAANKPTKVNGPLTVGTEAMAHTGCAASQETGNSLIKSGQLTESGTAETPGKGKLMYCPEFFNEGEK